MKDPFPACEDGDEVIELGGSVRLNLGHLLRHFQYAQRFGGFKLPVTIVMENGQAAHVERLRFTTKGIDLICKQEEPDGAQDKDVRAGWDF